ncbi:actin-10-related [Anaeramoeba ignava]|uniref:Actin-10-related n=1 Tax=Anaeramoeba ignava TaxID=1746090 RepID=A0A9Q0RCZ1_ANAIG|nr:actin-10-related [Anaeramoeba ignava]
MIEEDIDYQAIVIDNGSFEIRSVIQFKKELLKIGIIWRKCGIISFYNELKIAPEEHPVLIADSPFNPRNLKKKIQEIMFETFNTPAFYLGNSGILTLYSTGRTTGFVFGIGHEITFTEPIYEGYEIYNIIDQYQFGGNDLTNYLIKLLKEQDYSFDKSSDIEIAKKILKKNYVIVLLIFNKN